MKLIALMPTRNEEWIIGLSLRVVLRWCDSVVVLQHCCTDRTAEIVAEISAEHPGRVHLIVDDNPEWAEMAQRQRMLETARSHGATHLACTDADEVLTGNLLPLVREQIDCLPKGGFMRVGMPCIWRSLTQVRRDGIVWSNRSDLCLAFADKPDLCWKKTNGYDHHHREPHGARHVAQMRVDVGGVMHLQWASWRRLVAKHNLYKVMERVKYPDKSVSEIDRQYSQALDERGLMTTKTPDEWWAPYQDLLKFVDLDAVPWHEMECRRLIEQYGIEKFTGLNLFGVEQCALAS